MNQYVVGVGGGGGGSAYLPNAAAPAFATGGNVNWGQPYYYGYGSTANAFFTIPPNSLTLTSPKDIAVIKIKTLEFRAERITTLGQLRRFVAATADLDGNKRFAAEVVGDLVTLSTVADRDAKDIM